MGDVDEIEQAKKWIYDSLSGNAEITAVVSTRIYSDYLPDPPAARVFPYVLYDYLGGADVDALGTGRLLAKPLFQVRLVTDGRPTTASRKAAKRIDDVLQVAVHQSSGEFFFTSRREQTVNRPETDAATGQRYHNLGGLYRLWIGRSV